MKNLEIKGIPTFCINLEERRDRWEKVQKEFKSLKLNPIRIEGVKTEFGKGALSRGQWGCLQAHRNAVLEGINLDTEHFMVFEDDIVCCCDFYEIFDSWKQDVPSDWELLNFGARLVSEPEKVSDRVYRTFGTCNAHAYLIKTSLAEKLLYEGWFDGNNGPTDTVICSSSDRRTHYAFSMMLIWQDGGYSDIVEELIPASTIQQIVFLK